MPKHRRRLWTKADLAATRSPAPACPPAVLNPGSSERRTVNNGAASERTDNNVGGEIFEQRRNPRKKPAGRIAPTTDGDGSRASAAAEAGNDKEGGSDTDEDGHFNGDDEGEPVTRYPRRRAGAKKVDYAGLDESGQEEEPSTEGGGSDDEEERRPGERRRRRASVQGRRAKSETKAHRTARMSEASPHPQKERYDRLWDAKFEKLRAYQSRHGHCRVAVRDETNKALGQWVTNQRKHYKRRGKKNRKNPLTKARIQKLAGLGFDWDAKRGVDAWNSKYEELRAFKLRHGTCLVPSSRSDNRALGQWVAWQRTHYRLMNQGKTTSMTEDRKAKLERLGFTWNARKDYWKSVVAREDGPAAEGGRKTRQSVHVLTKATHQREQWDQDWEAKFEKLRAYKSRHGHCQVSKNEGALGRWVTSQRRDYRFVRQGKSSGMTEAREQRLASVGFVWVCAKLSPTAAWDDKFEELQAFKNRRGHCRVPERDETNGILGRWVASQRKLYRLMQRGKKHSLTKERQQRLTSLGFAWDAKRAAWNIKRDAWNSKYEELRAFKLRHGTCLVPKEGGHGENRNRALGQWVAVQRCQYSLMKRGKKTHMTADRKAKLERLEFTWNAKKKEY